MQSTVVKLRKPNKFSSVNLRHFLGLKLHNDRKAKKDPQLFRLEIYFRVRLNLRHTKEFFSRRLWALIGQIQAFSGWIASLIRSQSHRLCLVYTGRKIMSMRQGPTKGGGAPHTKIPSKLPIIVQNMRNYFPCSSLKMLARWPFFLLLEINKKLGEKLADLAR